MAETLTITGLVEKVSDTRSGWTLPLEISLDLDGDEGAKTFTIAAGATVSIPITLVTPADVLILKTPSRVNVTLTYTGVSPTVTVTSMPVLEFCFLRTTGLNTISVANPNSLSVLLTVCAGKLSTG